MRIWENQEPGSDKEPAKRDYETVGYVIKGKAELHTEGQMILLEKGDSWVVPKGASHTYKILENFHRRRSDFAAGAGARARRRVKSID
jgi:uncharacterized cupin superfamily protein